MSATDHPLLNAVRSRLKGTQPPPLPPVLDMPTARGGVDAFCQALEAVEGQVHRVKSSEDGLLILRGLAADRSWNAIACSDAAALSSWRDSVGLACHVHGLRDPIPRSELLEMDVGLCTAQLGIAETGTLVLCSESERHRLVSLVPPASVIVLFARDLVPDLASALRQLQTQALPTTTSFITGPSRTADIELTLTVGVHGPRSVDVILIEG